MFGPRTQGPEEPSTDGRRKSVGDGTQGPGTRTRRDSSLTSPGREGEEGLPVAEGTALVRHDEKRRVRESKTPKNAYTPHLNVPPLEFTIVLPLLGRLTTLNKVVMAKD